MQAIVAVDRAWGIGLKGGMLYDLPGDLKHFARHTKGGVLVMGRATLESLPGGQPLKGRDNIVLTRDQAYVVPGAHVVHSLAQLDALLKSYLREHVWLIGGQQLYQQLIDCCDCALVTRIDAQRPADRFFPNLDERPGWSISSVSDLQQEAGIDYSFCLYRNHSVKLLRG